MGLFDRMTTILRANVNSLLDNAEDPEKMIDQIIRDMNEAIRQARSQVADMIAEEKRLKAEMEENQELTTQWQQKAELALTKGSDDLAREALKRKRDYEDNVKVYGSQWQSQKDAVTKLKSDLAALEDKYEDAVRDRDNLIARHRRAEAQKTVSTAASNLSALDPSAELSRMEDRIQREEAKAAATAELSQDSLEQQIKNLEEHSELDDELAALKAKIQGGGSTTGQ